MFEEGSEYDLALMREVLAKLKDQRGKAPGRLVKGATLGDFVGQEPFPSMRWRGGNDCGGDCGGYGGGGVVSSGIAVTPRPASLLAREYLLTGVPIDLATPTPSVSPCLRGESPRLGLTSALRSSLVYPMLDMTRQLALFCALVTLAACRWHGYRPITLSRGTPPNITFEIALRTARNDGYAVLELDQPRGYLCVQSKECNETRGGTYLAPGFSTGGESLRSAFCMQVESDGSMRVTARGDCASEDGIYGALGEEYRQFVTKMDRNLKTAVRGPAISQ